MEFTPEALRLAALIHLADQNNTDAFQQLITNEIWMLRNGIDPGLFPDDTIHEITTATLIRMVQGWPGRTREENSHLLVCTIPVASEIIASEDDESLASMSVGANDTSQLGK